MSSRPECREGREILQCKAFLSCLIFQPWEKSFPKESSRSPRQLQVSTDKAGSPRPAQNTISGAKSNCCCWVWWLIYVILVRGRRRIQRPRSSSVTKKAWGQPRLHETSSPESINQIDNKTKTNMVVIEATEFQDYSYTSVRCQDSCLWSHREKLTQPAHCSSLPKADIPHGV